MLLPACLALLTMSSIRCRWWSDMTLPIVEWMLNAVGHNISFRKIHFTRTLTISHTSSNAFHFFQEKLSELFVYLLLYQYPSTWYTSLTGRYEWRERSPVYSINQVCIIKYKDRCLKPLINKNSLSNRRWNIPCHPTLLWMMQGWHQRRCPKLGQFQFQPRWR